jgi:hypothetical protein
MQSPPTFVRITCRPAADMQVGGRTVQGLLISAEDVEYLRTLEAQDAIATLECPGRKTVSARVRHLLLRLVRVPDSADYYVSVTGTGPLYTK